jgi:hypothetical protein
MKLVPIRMVLSTYRQLPPRILDKFLLQSCRSWSVNCDNQPKPISPSLTVMKAIAVAVLMGAVWAPGSASKIHRSTPRHSFRQVASTTARRADPRRTASALIWYVVLVFHRFSAYVIKSPTSYYNNPTLYRNCRVYFIWNSFIYKY